MKGVSNAQRGDPWDNSTARKPPLRELFLSLFNLRAFIHSYDLSRKLRKILRLSSDQNLITYIQVIRIILQEK